MKSSGTTVKRRRTNGSEPVRTMATLSLRLWTTTITAFLLCCMLSSAHRFKACDKNAARQILAHCFRWRRDVAIPKSQISQANQKDHHESIFSYSTQRTDKKLKTYDFSDILPLVTKRKMSALNMIAHVCCKMGCLISDICP